MQKLKNKSMAILIAAILTISIGASAMLVQAVSLAPGKVDIPTYTFCSVSPNPVGEGQTVNVNFWVNEPPPTASAQYGDRWHNMTVVVTTPGGTTTTLGPFISDDTGGTHTTYTPAVTGNYTFELFFGGQLLTGVNLPPGDTAANFVNIGDYYEPSHSAVFTLTVQSTPIAAAPSNSLPTSYWTRPINALNNNWYVIGGNWLGLAASTFAATGMYNSTGNYNPYTTAPTSAHVLWTKPVAFGGTIGGEFGGSEESNYYATAQYEPKFAPIIMQGILYYEDYPGASTNPTGWTAVNLQTGQVVWQLNNTSEILKCGQILDMITPNQYGALTYLWAEPASSAGFMAAGSSLSMYDAMTGAYILTITGTPTMDIVEDTHGDLIGYYVNTTNAIPGDPFSPIGAASLTLWNSTACINLSTSNYAGGPPVKDDWMWRPGEVTSVPFSQGVEWSAPLPLVDKAGAPLTYMASFFGMSFPSYLLGVSAVQSGVVYVSGTNSGAFAYQVGWEEEGGFSATNGALLWGVTNRTEVPYSIVYSGGVWSGSGAYVELTESTLSISGYSLSTGALLWGPTALPNVSPFSSLGANAVVANGNIYIWGYGGDVYSYNIVTGALNWQYHTPPGGYESPYGVEPIWTFTVGSIGGGILFLPEGHMYSPPLFRNAQQLALNITTGKVVWSFDAFDVTSAPAISDGIATTLNAYDNQIYAYGMGPSKTTVTAPDIGVTTATPITITGTVMDISAGTQQNAVAANFPNGLPCVSDASQSQWMEYVYEQQPMPTNVTGVPVTISVLDSNHNTRVIGTTTTNSFGTFAYTWTPNILGNYTLTATFAGSNSYYGSSADTYFYASAPPATTATPAASVANTYFVPAIAGLFVLIIIVLALVVLSMLRKRP